MTDPEHDLPQESPRPEAIAAVGRRATRAVVEALEAASIDYMIVGSFATNCHAPPRSTKDADLVVAPPGGPVARALRTLAAPYRLDPQIGFESVTGTLRYLLDVVGTDFDVECFLLSDDPHDRARFDRREREEVIPGFHAFVATAEDTVVTKLRWAKDAGRGKDRDDVRNVLGFRAGALDLPYIERWAAEHGTLDLYREIAASIPPLD